MKFASFIYIHFLAAILCSEEPIIFGAILHQLYGLSIAINYPVTGYLCPLVPEHLQGIVRLDKHQPSPIGICTYRGAGRREMAKYLGFSHMDGYYPFEALRSSPIQITASLRDATDRNEVLICAKSKDIIHDWQNRPPISAFGASLFIFREDNDNQNCLYVRLKQEFINPSHKVNTATMLRRLYIESNGDNQNTLENIADDRVRVPKFYGWYRGSVYGAQVIPSKLQRPFTIVSQIGEGSYGHVFFAQSPDGEQIAVKIFNTVDDESENYELLSKEPTHPNIVKYYGTCNVLGYPAIALEYIPSARTLQQVIEAHAWTFAMEAQKKSAEAFIYSRLPVIKRENDKDNILVDQNNNIKFIDFGALARL